MFESGSLLDRKIKAIIKANLYPVLTWHPNWPRKKNEQLEPKLWEETNKWNRGVILWIVSPDKKVREAIRYYDHKASKVVTAKRLEKRIREIFAKHKLKFVEPKLPKKPAPPADG